MRLFKKNKNTRRVERPFVAQLRAALDNRQRMIAGYLGRKTVHWDRSSKIIALALFCLFFGGLSLFLKSDAVIIKTRQK
jgi:hypothetical protein